MITNYPLPHVPSLGSLQNSNIIIAILYTFLLILFNSTQSGFGTEVDVIWFLAFEDLINFFQGSLQEVSLSPAPVPGKQGATYSFGLDPESPLHDQLRPNAPGTVFLTIKKNVTTFQLALTR